MPLTAGTVSIDPNTEAVTGSGWALARFNGEMTITTLPALPTVGQMTSPYSSERAATQTDVDQMKAMRISILEGIATRAEASAIADVAYIVANLTVVIPTDVSAGAVPSSLTAGTPIDPPAAPVALDIS